MNKRHFNAFQWLNNTQTGLIAQETRESISASTSNDFAAADMSSLARELPPPPPLAQHQINQYFTPDWRGDGLLSRHAMTVKNCVDLLWQNAQAQFGQHSHFNKSLKQAAFVQFTALCHKLGYSAQDISSTDIFWRELHNPKSAHKETLHIFKEHYTFRAMTVYLYKLKFIAHLADDLPFHMSDDYLYNPNAYLTSVFRKGSSSELFCSALWPNAFSWFRPASSIKNKLTTLAVALKQLSTAEMMKVCTYSHYRPNQFKDADQEFSHSFSHRALGIWLNQLLIHLPQWIEKGPLQRLPNHKKKYPEVLNTLLWGNHVPSLCQSHWLAQESNLSPEWTKILCPDFMDENKGDGPYFKICHELQYLTFLLKVANKLSEEAVPFLCTIMRQKYLTHRDQLNGQMSMFQGDAGPQLVYQRIVLNLLDMPKNNPHFYLISKVDQFASQLSANGLMYIFTSQKLFVPSQNEKIRQLLNDYRLEASFAFEELKGKGEIPNHLYVLSKRTAKHTGQLPAVHQAPLKESCLCFRMQGDLTQFNKFGLLSQEFLRFMQERPTTTLAFHGDSGDGLSMQFHQDAIVDGVLVQSSKEGNLTHPNFFKNLTTKCLPLDHFFLLEHIDPTSDQVPAYNNDLFAQDLLRPKTFPYVLVVNFNDPNMIQLKIISGNALNAHIERYGCAYYSYLGMLPKRNDLNINIFREYFQSKIGTQIIQLSLNGGPTKIKGKLKSLLIPATFRYGEMPAAPMAALECLTLAADKILLTNIEQLRGQFAQARESIKSASTQYSWYLLGLLSHFRAGLVDASHKVNGPSGGLLRNSKQHDRKILFENPSVSSALVSLKASPIYPYHEDLFIEITTSQKQNIHLPLMLHRISHLENNQFCLALDSSEGEVVRLHSDRIMLDFIEFILQRANGVPISKILSSLKVPSLNDMKNVVSKHELFEKGLSELASETQELVNQIFTDLISKQT